MLRKRLPIFLSDRSRSILYRKYCSTKNPNDNEDTNTDADKKYDPKDRIMNILNVMIEENAQRGCQKYESKFPNENKGFKKSQLPNNYNFKSDDSDELKLHKAVSAVVESISDNKEEAKNDLLTKAIEMHKPSDVDWRKLISGMKVDREEESKQFTRADAVKKILKHTSNQNIKPRLSPHTRTQQQMERVNLEDKNNLGIFENIEQYTSGVELKTWNYLKENELRIAITHPPTNYFQKMISWTNQGKIWKFPIDNEQGLEAEQSVHFSEHIFLEPHLEGWCPTRGPVRHFMELVCIGLSKNPYMTVQEKVDYIMWFKDYLGNKVELLQQTGALQDGFSDKVAQVNNSATAS